MSDLVVMSKTSVSLRARETTSAWPNSTCRSLAAARSLSMKASQPASPGLACAGAAQRQSARTASPNPDRITRAPRRLSEPTAILSRHHDAGNNGERSTLVIFGDQAVEQPDAPTRSPGLVDLVRRRTHRRAGDVEMRPGRIVDEALEELRRGDRAGVSPAGVLHVGEFGIDQLVVGGRRAACARPSRPSPRRRRSAGRPVRRRWRRARRAPGRARP